MRRGVLFFAVVLVCSFVFLPFCYACDPSKGFDPEACQAALGTVTDGGSPSWSFPKSVQGGVNDYNPDCRPSLTADGKKLFFQTWNLNGPSYPGYQGKWDVFYSIWQGEKWGPAISCGLNVNTENVDERPCITPDGSRLYFSSDRPGGAGGLDIYYSDWDGKEFGPAVSLGPDINTQGSESDPFVTADQKTLYFISDRPGGFGAADIYISHRTDTGWSKPENMGSAINSADQDTHPFLTADGKKFYFGVAGSTQRPTYGNWDIFVSERTESGWSPGKALGAPICTDWPTCSPYVSPDGKKFYFGSEASEGGYGDEDIWSADLLSEPPVEPAVGTKASQPAGALYIHCLIEGTDKAMYAGTAPFGDVFRSTDNGETWEKLGEIPGAIRVYSLLQAKDGTIYAGTYPNGDVFKTADKGKTWANTADMEGVTAIKTLYQLKEGTILAGVAPNFGREGKIFSTTNGGETWELRSMFPGNMAGALSLLEAKDGAVYLGSWALPNRIYRSDDKGRSWAETAPFPVPGTHPSSFNTLMQASDGAIYTGGWLHENGGYIFKTADGGKSWIETGRIMLNKDVHAVRVYTLLEDDNGYVYAGLQPGLEEMASLFRSANHGESWEIIEKFKDAREILCLLKASDGNIYLGTTPNGKIYRYTPVTVKQPEVGPSKAKQEKKAH